MLKHSSLYIAPSKFETDLGSDAPFIADMRRANQSQAELKLQPMDYAGTLVAALVLGVFVLLALPA